MKTTRDMESALRRLRELLDARGQSRSGEVIDLDQERRKRAARTHNGSRRPQLTGPRESEPDRNE